MDYNIAHCDCNNNNNNKVVSRVVTQSQEPTDDCSGHRPEAHCGPLYGYVSTAWASDVSQTPISSSLGNRNRCPTDYLMRRRERNGLLHEFEITKESEINLYRRLTNREKEADPWEHSSVTVWYYRCWYYWFSVDVDRKPINGRQWSNSVVPVLVRRCKRLKSWDPLKCWWRQPIISSQSIVTLCLCLSNQRFWSPIGLSAEPDLPSIKSMTSCLTACGPYVKTWPSSASTTSTASQFLSNAFGSTYILTISKSLFLLSLCQ